MKLVKNLMDYFNLNKHDKVVQIATVVEKPKPVQKKKEKKPFPYYRKVYEYDETIDYQCLACKEHFSVGYETQPKFCLYCGIEFEGQWTKQNPRYGHKYSNYKYPRILTHIRLYNRKNITKSKMDKDSFSFHVDVPVTAERLEFTKDKDNYYEWEKVSHDAIIPLLTHKSSRIILNEQKKRMQYYVKTNKLIQLWAGPEGKEKMICEIKGLDEVYPVGYGQIQCSGTAGSLNYILTGISG